MCVRPLRERALPGNEAAAGWRRAAFSPGEQRGWFQPPEPLPRPFLRFSIWACWFAMWRSLAAICSSVERSADERLPAALVEVAAAEAPVEVVAGRLMPGLGGWRVGPAARGGTGNGFVCVVGV